jgi:hypothetical protein
MIAAVIIGLVVAGFVAVNARIYRNAKQQALDRALFRR